MADDPGVADDKPDEPRGHWQCFAGESFPDADVRYIATWSADGRSGRDYEVRIPINVDPETGALTFGEPEITEVNISQVAA